MGSSGASAAPIQPLFPMNASEAGGFGLFGSANRNGTSPFSADPFNPGERSVRRTS